MLICFDYYDIEYDGRDGFTISFKVHNEKERKALENAIENDEEIEITIEV